jgi:hypothetical protein
MKTYTQPQKIVSVLITYILLIQFTGCYSTKIISTSEITQSDSYLVHSKKSTYLAYNVTISDEILSGTLDFNNKKFTDPKYLHIYLSSDSLLTINNSQISFPINSIKEIKQKVPDAGKTKTLKILLIVAGVTVVTVSVLGVIAMISFANDVEKCQVDQSVEEILNQFCSTGY